MVAGVKNHHLKSVSTPQQFFTQQVFRVLQPFLAIKLLLQSPASCVCVSAATQASPKQEKRF
jgi:hypothetical protein